MHYKKKLRAKALSPSFYLEKRLLDLLKLASEIQNQPQSRIIECALRFYFGESYERAKKRSFKTKKKIFTTKRHIKKYQHKSTQSVFKQKCLFDL